MSCLAISSLFFFIYCKGGGQKVSFLVVFQYQYDLTVFFFPVNYISLSFNYIFPLRQRISLSVNCNYVNIVVQLWQKLSELLVNCSQLYFCYVNCISLFSQLYFNFQSTVLLYLLTVILSILLCNCGKSGRSCQSESCTHNFCPQLYNNLRKAQKIAFSHFQTRTHAPTHVSP